MSFEMWAEKYRPKTLTEMVNQKAIVERLSSFARSRNVPHCIFAGPPGTGKTTAALCLARDMYGQAYREHLMELNASDERGINVVRETVKTFARIRTLGEIPFKLLILDEADNMTRDAQQALRRTMERYAATCRFILIANYSGKIIEPIQSRCAPFRYRYLSRDDQDEYLRRIAEKEGINLLKDGLDAVYDASGGDLRRATNLLQAAASLEKPVDSDLVFSVVGHANPADVHEMMELAMKGEFIEARKRLREMITKYGVAGTDIVKQIHLELFRLNIPENMKVKAAGAVGEADFRLSEGASEEVQLSALLAKLAETGIELKGG